MMQLIIVNVRNMLKVPIRDYMKPIKNQMAAKLETAHVQQQNVGMFEIATLQAFCKNEYIKSAICKLDFLVALHPTKIWWVEDASKPRRISFFTRHNGEHQGPLRTDGS